MPGAKYDIYVYEDAGVFYARPAPVIVDRQKGKLKVRNLTKKKITLTFQDGVVTENPTVITGNHGDIELDPAADGIYGYDIGVKLTTKFSGRALGNSAPKIIVDP
ncbi:MAG: hypothetical protein ACM3NQ_06360 [Bacteroidales bacterium]